MNGKTRATSTAARRRPTSTAATRRTEPAVVAGISSAEGQPSAHRPAHRGLAPQSGVLLAAALALGAAAGSWLRRVAWRG